VIHELRLRWLRLLWMEVYYLALSRAAANAAQRSRNFLHRYAPSVLGCELHGRNRREC